MTAICRLYLITPPVIDDLLAFGAQLNSALAAGDAAALQLRLKGADDDEVTAAVARLMPICKAHDTALILNDNPVLAARLGCDGVHIGQTDGSLKDARALLGQDKIIGVTCHDSRHLAMDAAEGGADYVAFGAFFPTSTKATTATPDVEILSIWQEVMLTPCVAIGGITSENCRPLVVAGADYLAVSAGIWAHPQGAAAAVRAFTSEIHAGLAERPVV